MYFRITSDANQESGIGPVVDKLSGPTRAHFQSIDYGPGLQKIVVVLMCRNPEYDFKKRIRFLKNDQTLYMDVMLDLVEMVSLNHEERFLRVFKKLENDISEVLIKYNFSGFDRQRFVNDLCEWLNKNKGSHG